MERLTQRLRTGEVLMASEYEEKYTEQEWISVLQDRLADYEDTGLTPGEVKSMQEEHFSGLEMAKLHSALMELKKYQEADKDGRLVVLPCQSGDHVFAMLDGQKRVRECEVKYAVLDGWLKVLYLAPIDDHGNLYSAPFGAFGQSIFLTREEAEAALEAKKDE